MRIHQVLTLATLVTSIGAGAAELSGRGIHPLASTNGCPFATAGASPCNRIALDDAHTRATVDAGARRIVFHNEHEYDDKTTVGDVLLQGSGEKADGTRVPLSLHLVLEKEDDDDWSINRHVHAPAHGGFKNVIIDAYEVQVNDGDDTETVLTAAQVRELLERPSLATRLAGGMVQVRDNRAAKAGAPADITIALGRGKVAKQVMRARLETGPGASAGKADVAGLLASDTWSVELQALTGKIPDRVIQRELFLYGLDALPLLQPLRERGFRKGEKLVIGAQGGRGYVRFGGARQDFPQAPQAMLGFLQQSFIGLILGAQQFPGSGAGAR